MLDTTHVSVQARHVQGALLSRKLDLSLTQVDTRMDLSIASLRCKFKLQSIGAHMASDGEVICLGNDSVVVHESLVNMALFRFAPGDINGSINLGYVPFQRNM